MIIYAFISALTWLAVTLLSHGFLRTNGFFYDLPNGQMPFGRFFILYIFAFLVYLIAIIKVPKLSETRRDIIIVLAGAIVFRLLLLPGIPIHENDIYRYIWDGKVSVSGINPYKYPPIQASIKPSANEVQTDFEKLKSLRDEDPKSYRYISFKDVPTVYPPLAQAIFAASTLIAPGSVLFMKFLFVLFDIAVVYLLYIILKSLKQNPLYVVVYAWNPLVLKEFANSGHYDVIAIFCVTAAVYLILKEKYIFSSLCMGLGVLSKIYPLIFIPFFIIKRQYKAFFTSLCIITLGHLPFFWWGNIDITAVFSGLGTYTQEWANSGFIFNLIYSLSSIFGNNSYLFSKIICGSVFCIIWIVIYLNKQNLIEKIFWSVTAMFLLSPVGDSWYFCWVIHFLCIYRKWSLIALSFLLILHYFVFTRDFGTLNIGSYKIDNLLLMQYVPFYLFFLAERVFYRSVYMRNRRGDSIQRR